MKYEDGLLATACLCKCGERIGESWKDERRGGPRPAWPSSETRVRENPDWAKQTLSRQKRDKGIPEFGFQLSAACEVSEREENHSQAVCSRPPVFFFTV